jgi:hypothetical protein
MKWWENEKKNALNFIGFFSILPLSSSLLSGDFEARKLSELNTT